MVHHVIKDLILLLLVSLPINIVFHRIKLPSVMGYLVAGVLIGPYGLKLISDISAVKELAEIGVVLLLFVIGLEFSLGRILKNLASILRGRWASVGNDFTCRVVCFCRNEFPTKSKHCSRPDHCFE